MTAADPGSMLAAGEARREASPADGWPDSMPTAGAGATTPATGGPHATTPAGAGPTMPAGRAVAVSAAMAELTAEVARSVVVIRGGPGSSGSGVVWDRPRLVITNHHVVPGPQAQVVLPDGRRLPARVTRRAPALDLVALELDTDLSGAARVGDSDRLRPGDLVLAVGNPMAERNASTLGIVCARPAEHLQVAIDLRPGNSGGALANARGEVVGIPHMVTGAGLALAVPSATVARFLGGDAEPLRWL